MKWNGMVDRPHCGCVQMLAEAHTGRVHSLASQQPCDYSSGVRQIHDTVQSTRTFADRKCQTDICQTLAVVQVLTEGNNTVTTTSPQEDVDGIFDGILYMGYVIA